MKREKYEQKRAELTRQILDRYHYDTAVSITGDRYYIYRCPEQVRQLHYNFACLITAYVPPGGEAHYIKRLKRVRNALRIQYQLMKGGKLYERIVSLFGISAG